MQMRFLKPYLPRSLYGRAALILLVPVVTLQLVVSIVFIQRHFEGVTDQMTRNVALELRFLVQEVNRAPTPAAARAAVLALAAPLAFDVSLPDEAPDRDRRRFYDFSGKEMILTLHDEIPQVVAVDLGDASRDVAVWLDTDHGVLRAGFDRRRVAASNPHQLLVLMVFAGILLTLVAIIFMRNQLRPIKRLARAAEAFGKGRVEPYRPTGALEVRAAGNAFLDMRARIERQIEQRTMMLSGVSHDIRTPLTRLKLGLAMLDPEAEVEALLRDVSDMERLLEEFLAFSRGDTLDDPEPCQPEDLIKDIVTKYSGSGQDVRLVAVSGEGTATLRPMAVARALDNLIGNAIRYGQRAEVRLTMTARTVVISVEDPGPGIAVELREQALKPFARLDAARNQDRGTGVGLGLAIAHDIARRHGGNLVLGASESLGGLRVDLILPR